MEKTTSYLVRSVPALTVAALAAAVGLGGPAPVQAKTFIQSDDYKEGEEITGVFLTDQDYEVMVDDLERRGQEFDWGWARSVRWENRRAEGKKVRPENEVETLAFDVSSHETVRIPAVENFAGIMKPEELAEVRQAFTLAAEQLGLTVVEEGQPADLELAAAVVDVNREGGGFGIFKVDPFIELEVRLRDLTAGQDLLLLRHQKHAETPGGSAMEVANMLVMFLR